MELILTENGIEQKSRLKLTETDRREILERSRERSKPLQLVKNGKVEPRLCKGCFKEIACDQHSPYCLTCIDVIAFRERSKRNSKDLKILVWVILIAGFFVAVLASGKFFTN